MGKKYDLETELARTIKFIQELSVDGFAPAVNEYDFQCSGGKYRRSGFFAPHGIQWVDLVKRAGLVSRPRGRVPGQSYGKRDSVPAAVEAEIQEIFAKQRQPEKEIGRRRAAGLRDEEAREIEQAFAGGSGWPLYAIPTRIEERIVALDDGTIRRVTRYHASIR
jgi:hypothetical protein